MRRIPAPVAPFISAGLVLVLVITGCGKKDDDDPPTPSDVQFGSASYLADENVGSVTITVARTGNVAEAATVDYTTSDVTATGGADYVPAFGTLSWVAGEGAPKTFVVAVMDDYLVESSETLFITLANPTGGALLGTPSAASLNIVDDDVPGTLQFSTNAYQVSEAGPTATITATRTGGRGGAVSVAYSTVNGTAVAGSDFIAASGVLSWAPGDLTDKTFAVSIIDDSIVEADELANLVLSAPTGGASLGQNTALLAIIENDSSLQFDFAVYSVAESGGAVTVGVTRVGGNGAAVGVDYSTSDGTATLGSDYSAASGTLAWPPGDGTPKTFTINIVDDFIVEGDETVNIALGGPTGGALLGAPSAAVLTISNDDQPGTLRFSAATTQVGETGGTTTITVDRTAGNGNAVTVDYATSDGTATAGSDYTAVLGTLAWAAGDATSKTFTIGISDDSIVEGDETVNLALSNPTGGASLGAPSSGVLMILDDEVTLQLDSASYPMAEGGGTATITVSRAGGTSGSVTVDYATSDGTATAGSDYAAAVGTLSWPAGDGTDKTFNIDIVSDTVIEGDETLDIALGSPTGGAVVGTPGAAVLTIIDDDVTLQLGSATYQVPEGGGAITITVTRLGTTTGAVSVDYAASGVTASPGLDYTSVSGTLSWPGGDGADKTFDIPILDDALGEGDETVNLILSTPTGGASLGAPSTGVLTIVDDDVSLEFASGSYLFLENGGVATITVTRAGTTVGAVTVDYASSDGSALDGADYSAVSGTLSWPGGDGADKTFTVPILDDALPEGSETIDLALSAPTGGATLGVPSTATLTIIDDEANLQLGSATFSVTEDGVTATITATRTGDTTGLASVDYGTSDGTAIAGSDYVAASGTLIWPAGDGADKTFTIDITDDTLVEGNETVDVTLTTAVGAALGSPFAGVLTILDDDIRIAGMVTFDRVPVTPASGLDYPSTVASPSRGVILEAVRESDLFVLDATTTDDFGDYSVVVPMNTNIYLRVSARLFATGSPSWDFQVVDNTASQALYSSVTSTFDSGPVDITGNDVHLPSGWGGSSYSSIRHAAPFAILDDIYVALQKVLAADPGVDLPLLLMNWSVDNIPVWGDKTIGEVGNPHYDPGEVAIYLLGKEDDETDEYDRHVVLHEWSHYFDDQLSRTDSLGGSHFLGEMLDMRIAFGEGLATALAGVFLDDPEYIDTYGTSQGSILVYQDMEDNSEQESSEGWFSETSVQILVYDFYDGVDDGADTLTLGFGPIYDVLILDQPTTEAFSTIFSFGWYLKQANPLEAPLIDTLLAGEQMTTTAVGPFDSTGTESNDGGEWRVLPVYPLVVVGGGASTLCTNGAQGNYNKLANRKYFRFVVASSGSYTIQAVPDVDGDPVIVLYYQGAFVDWMDANGAGSTETLTVSLNPGTYVGEVYHWGNVEDLDMPEDCFSESVN